MIAPYRIIFNGYSNRDFGLICDCAFDSDSGETSTYLSREAIISETHDGVFNRVHSYKWGEVFRPRFTFIKDDFSDFSLEEQRKVLKWLTLQKTASFLSVYYDDSEVIEFEILGGFIEIETYKLANNRTVGICATFESTSPFAFSPLQTITKNMTDPTDNTITVNVSTDEPQSPIYPRIIIKQNSETYVVEIDHAMTNSDEWTEGTIYHYNDTYYWLNPQPNETTGGVQYIKTSSTIKPTNIETTSVVITSTYTDDYGNLREVKSVIKNNIRGETITLDGANRIVSSDRIMNRVIGDGFNWVWIPFFEGVNTISVVGNCTVTLEWREPIKCGEY